VAAASGHCAGRDPGRWCAEGCLPLGRGSGAGRRPHSPATVAPGCLAQAEKLISDQTSSRATATAATGGALATMHEPPVAVVEPVLGAAGMATTSTAAGRAARETAARGFGRRAC
jgi:hypothetical protein